MVEGQFRSTTIQIEYVIAFTWQNWVAERTAILRYMYIVLKIFVCIFMKKRQAT